MPPPPVVKSVLIADAVIQDRATGKWSVIGVFDRVAAPSFPCAHPTVAVYVRITDALGRYKVRIELRDAEDVCVSAFEGIEVEVADRLQVAEFGCMTHGLPLQKPGKYQFQLYFNGEFATAVPLDVVRMQPPAAP
jgi:hypothetical protein